MMYDMLRGAVIVFNCIESLNGYHSFWEVLAHNFITDVKLVCVSFLLKTLTISSTYFQSLLRTLFTCEFVLASTYSTLTNSNLMTSCTDSFILRLAKIYLLAITGMVCQTN